MIQQNQMNPLMFSPLYKMELNELKTLNIPQYTTELAVLTGLNTQRDSFTKNEFPVRCHTTFLSLPKTAEESFSWQQIRSHHLQTALNIFCSWLQV